MPLISDAAAALPSPPAPPAASARVEVEWHGKASVVQYL